MTCLLLFVSIETKAQEAGKNSSVAATNSAKGRKELRKDKRIKRHEARALKSNQKKTQSEANKPFHKAHLKKAKRKNVEKTGKY